MIKKKKKKGAGQEKGRPGVASKKWQQTNVPMKNVSLKKYFQSLRTLTKV